MAAVGVKVSSVGTDAFNTNGTSMLATHKVAMPKRLTIATSPYVKVYQILI
jgi:hypothetical protein